MNILQRALKLEPEEVGPVSLLLLNGFFVGLFIASFDVGAATLFLDTQIESLPMGFIGQGLFGFIATIIFAYFQNKVRYSTLAVSILILIGFVVTGLRLSFELYPDSPTVVFISFVCALPFSIIALLVFWGAVNRMFSLRQAKRMYGIIDAGQVIATIIAFVTVPFLLDYTEVINLLYISLIGVVLTLLSFVFIFKRYPAGLVKQATVENIDEDGNVTSTTARNISYGFASFFNNKFILLMSVFMVISSIAMIIVDSSFLQVTVIQYPEQNDLGYFLARFSAFILIFNLIIQVGFADRIVNMYGLKLALIINPALLGILTLISILVATFFGYTNETGSNFLLFFLAISLSKFFTSALKESIDEGTLRMFFIPLDSAVRIDVQTKIEGSSKFFAVLVAGGVLYIIDSYSFTLLHVTILLVLFVIGWIYVTDKMYSKYRNSLKATLSGNKAKMTLASRNEFSIDRILLKELETQNSDKVIYTLKVMEKIEPALLESTVNSLIYDESPVVKKYAQDKAQDFAISNVEHKDVNNRYESVSLLELSTLTKSRKIEDRLKAVKIIGSQQREDSDTILIDLLRDVDMEVRKEAINGARKFKRAETWPLMIEFLGSPALSNLAASALISAGVDVLNTLEYSFHKSGQNDKIMLRIIQIYGRIGGERALELLWNKIDYPDKRVVNQVLLAFSYLNLQIGEEKQGAIYTLIDTDIANGAWNIAALAEIDDIENNQYLRAAIKEEISSNFERIYMQMSLIYDRQSIQLVRDSIESGTAEGVVFALELLDVFINKDLKPKLFPLLDEISTVEKLNALQNYFPRDNYTSNEVVNYIVNRDFNSTNRWTKVCALYSLAMNDEEPITDDLIANLFNPDSLLRETSAWAIYKKERTVFSKLSNRISPSIKKELDRVLDTIFSKTSGDFIMPLKIEKLIFLKQNKAFEKIPGVVLSELIEALRELRFKRGEDIITAGINGNAPIYLLVRGLLKVHENGSLIDTVTEKDFYGENLVLNNDFNKYTVTALEESVVYAIDKDIFYELMTKNHQLTRGFFMMMSKRLSRETSRETNKLSKLISGLKIRSPKRPKTEQ